MSCPISAIETIDSMLREWQDKATQDNTRQSQDNYKTRQDKTRQDNHKKTRQQDKTKQDKTRQDKITIQYDRAGHDNTRLD